MSDLRRGLNDWAASHGTRVAEHLRQGDSESTARVQSARRRRTRALGGAAAAVVMVAGVAWAATALPGTGAPVFVPAAPVTLDPVEVPAILACGETWVLSEGVEVHQDLDPGSFTRAEWFAAWNHQGSELEPGPLTAGDGDLQWYNRLESAPQQAAWLLTTVVAVDGDRIVGVTPASGASVEEQAVEFGMSAPLPGVCGDAQRPAADGAYTFHVVAQLLTEGGEPIATYVDPAGPFTLEVLGLEEWFASQPTPPPTPNPTPNPTPDPQPSTKPGGDTYKAYVVDRPAPRTACDALQELRAQGEPTADRLTYQVTIPGMQDVLAPERKRGPLAIADESITDAWYFSEPAWLVYDSPGSAHEPPLKWYLDTFSLEGIRDHDLRAPGSMQCPVAAVSAPASGGMWIVIDGVDGQALGEAYPTMDLALDDMMTWVYIGEIREPE